ncbi:hypothetical protein WICPIJ_007931 [Wickerhamomyces pijperi]|uniref:Uncharacterized protein n=1 Tax=Wickerhamomyces pijperi TaxID=599730 RepID=A0A9P8Q1G8_WICPI|nr:hypothetical protein WICPIJ_007931 [Wickerhamomyces pijperi]
MSEKLLTMFFDDEFVPHAYLDALYSGSVSKSKPQPTGNTSASSNQYLSSKDIKELRQRSSVLLSHLDYYTKELTTDLEGKIQKLYNSNSIISYSYDHSNKSNDKLKPTTRLEYYVNSLSISLSSLRDSIQSISEKIEQSGDSKDSISTKLINLNQSKDNLLKVLDTLNVIKSIIEINQDMNETKKRSSVSSAPTTTTSSSKNENLTISLKSFQDSLQLLQATVLEQFDLAKNGNVSKELLTKVKELIELAPVFKNLGGFGTAYASFVKNMENAVSKLLDNNTA